MERSPLHQQIDTLPDLVRDMIDNLIRRAREVFPSARCRRLERIFVTGCGDSHHAAVNSELAFEQLAGIPCEPQPAMQFSRYAAGYMPNSAPGTNLVLGVSVSGQVSRTVEAIAVAQEAGALTAALTGNRKGDLAAAAELLLETAVPPLPAELSGLIVPGTRSYYASQLALYLLAIHFGQERGNLSQAAANKLRRDLASTADFIEQAIAANDGLAHKAAEMWLDADTFVYCGSGPNYGSALFGAAKLLEASGDSAVAQDLEEWAHLQYFARQTDTPTFLISSDDRDADRAMEIATAARTIGRRLALITPERSRLSKAAPDILHLPITDGLRACFSPLLTVIPPLLFAAYRAQLLGEPYFRGFGGGRSSEGGGGISRIRTSHQITKPIV